MDRCFGCGYMWADLDDEGRPITNEYCHYEGPDAYVPCAQDMDEYIHEIDVEARKAEEEYERWLEEQARQARQARLAEDEEPDGYWDWALSGDYDELSDETVEAIRSYK